MSYFPFKDFRILENEAIIEKIHNQFVSYEEKFSARLILSSCTFIINFENLRQVLINFPMWEVRYFGEFVLIAEVEGFENYEDILLFFSKGDDNKVKLVNPDNDFPYFFKPKSELNRLFPARLASPGIMMKFLIEEEDFHSDVGKMFYECHIPLDKLEMYKIHLIIHDKNNNEIYNSIFQDFK